MYKEETERGSGKERYDGPLTIAIEILSSSTMFNDFNIKSNKYMISGVKEYWIVDHKNQTFIINDFVNKTMTTFEKSDVLKSNIFEDLKIKLEDIFE